MSYLMMDRKSRMTLTCQGTKQREGKPTALRFGQARTMRKLTRRKCYLPWLIPYLKRSNSRVTDFYNLNKPFEDMFDRTKTPREPWHDIGLQVIGHPAKDLCRHFVQRYVSTAPAWYLPSNVLYTDGTCFFVSKTIHGTCHSCCHLPTSHLGSSKTTSYQEHAKCKSVAPRVPGQ